MKRETVRVPSIRDMSKAAMIGGNIPLGADEANDAFKINSDEANVLNKRNG